MTPSPWWTDLLNPRRVLGGEKVVAHCSPDDAPVIAAAPELLAHLKFAVKLLTPLLGATAQVQAMQDAINKAENTDGE